MVQVAEAEKSGWHSIVCPEAATDCISQPTPLSVARMPMTFTGHASGSSSVSGTVTGLLDCQARNEKALDFACNASLAAVNITKVLKAD